MLVDTTGWEEIVLALLLPLMVVMRPVYQRLRWRIAEVSDSWVDSVATPSRAGSV